MDQIPGILRVQIPMIGHGTKKAWVRFKDPQSNASWYVTEFDGKDLCYGLIVGMISGWGYFFLSEIALIRNPMGLPMVMDKHWIPQDIE